MATILVIILRVNRPNIVHFRTVNVQKPIPKGEAAAWSAYSRIRACHSVMSVSVNLRGLHVFLSICLRLICQILNTIYRSVFSWLGHAVSQCQILRVGQRTRSNYLVWTAELGV